MSPRNNVDLPQLKLLPAHEGKRLISLFDDALILAASNDLAEETWIIRRRLTARCPPPEPAGISMGILEPISSFSGDRPLAAYLHATRFRHQLPQSIRRHLHSLSTAETAALFSNQQVRLKREKTNILGIS